MINPGADMVVLPLFPCVGGVVQVSAVVVAQTPIPPHLKEIVTWSHPSLGVDGRTALTNILHKYSHISSSG